MMNFFRNRNSYLNTYFSNLQPEDLTNFQNHYEDFKPVLAELVSDNDNTGEDLIHSHHMNRLQNVKWFEGGFKSDLHSLLNSQRAASNRGEFVNKVIAEYNGPEGDEWTNFNQVIESLNLPHSTTLNITRAFGYFHSEEGNRVINEGFRKYRFLADITTHEDFQTCVNLLSESFKNLTNDQLVLISHIINNYEQFSIVSMEPLLLNVLGSGLFFKILIPIHKRGCLETLINRTMDNLKYKAGEGRNNNPFSSVFSNLNNSLNLISNWTSNHPWLTSLGSFCAQQLLKKFFMHTPQIGPATKAIDSVIVDGGFNNEKINTARGFLGRVVFEIGNTVSVISRNFSQGFLKQWENPLRHGATIIDKEIGKK